MKYRAKATNCISLLQEWLDEEVRTCRDAHDVYVECSNINTADIVEHLNLIVGTTRNYLKNNGL
jgi:hypothetical protein